MICFSVICFHEASYFLNIFSSDLSLYQMVQTREDIQAEDLHINSSITFYPVIIHHSL